MSVRQPSKRGGFSRASAKNAEARSRSAVSSSSRDLRAKGVQDRMRYEKRGEFGNAVSGA